MIRLLLFNIRKDKEVIEVAEGARNAESPR